MIGLIAFLIGLCVANYNFVSQSPGGNDFLARWTGAHYWLVEGISPYDEEVSLAAQMMIYGRAADPSKGEDIAHFVYPLPAMLFFGPFGFLPFAIARAIWMTILEICLVVLGLIGLRLARWSPDRYIKGFVILFSILWYHGARSVIIGQFAVIEAVLIAIALLAIQSELDEVAGIVLALTIAKPQMSFLIIPFVLIWAIRARRLKIVGWFLGITTILIAGSLMALPSWPLGWLGQLFSYPSYTDLGSPISILANLLPRGGSTVNLILTGLLSLYLLWEWILAAGKEDSWFQWAAAMTIVITNLIAFRTATTNFVGMLPALLIIFKTWEDRWGKGGVIASSLTLLGLSIGLWFLFLGTVQVNVESAVMYLPLPILTLVGLLWSRWWVISAARLPMRGD
ncbi:MAG: glycosyltransferase 87 family protein [Anaerolineales bacterium]